MFKPIRCAALTIPLSIALLGLSGTSCSSSSSNTPPQAQKKPPTAVFSTYQSASQVIGQADFLTKERSADSSSNALNQSPIATVVVGSKVFIVDMKGNRVLGYNSPIRMTTTPPIRADFALGQPTGGANLTSRVSGSGITQMNFPADVHARDNYLVVADFGNNRILIYNTIPGQAGVTPVAAVAAGTTCLPNGLNGPASVYITPQGKLIVADLENNRVLIWNSVSRLYGSPTQRADLILGDDSCNPGTSLSQMSNPTGVWSDDNRLVVVDNYNARVLVWNTFPTTSQKAASFILGQTSMSGISAGLFKAPFRATSDGFRLAVSDQTNHRVLIWNTFPSESKPADVVLGQADMTTGVWNANGGPSEVSDKGFFNPAGIYLDNDQLWVSDSENFRTLIFEAK